MDRKTMCANILVQKTWFTQKGALTDNGNNQQHPEQFSRGIISAASCDVADETGTPTMTLNDDDYKLASGHLFKRIERPMFDVRINAS
ncbi:hypothetical protein TNCV_4137861 [Trichonephila clavipes]|nr:hypothetical protein TNCV_4137861 [Trichonephila clavipes]